MRLCNGVGAFIGINERGRLRGCNGSADAHQVSRLRHCTNGRGGSGRERERREESEIMRRCDSEKEQKTEGR